MAEYNFLCSFGEATCLPQPVITRSEQHIVINRYLIPWLEYQLKGDCTAGAQFDSLIGTDTSIVFQKTCMLCNTTSIIDYTTTFNVEIFPNPFNNKLFFHLNESDNKITIDLYSINGCKIFSQMLVNTKENKTFTLNLDENLPSGIYLLKLTIDEHQFARKLIRQ